MSPSERTDAMYINHARGEKLNREQTCKGRSVNVMYIILGSSIAQLAADERGESWMKEEKFINGGWGVGG